MNRAESTPRATNEPQRSQLRRVGETCLWVIVISVTVVGAVKLASTLRIIVLPTFLALVLASLLAPVVRWFRHHRWPRAGASLAVVTAFVLVLGGLMAWLGPAVVGQLGSLETSVTGGLREIEEWLIEDLGFSQQQISEAVDRAVKVVRDNLGNLAQGLFTGAALIFQVLAGLLLAVVVLFFFLKDGDRMWAWVQSLVPRRHRDAFRGAGESSWSALAAFLRAQTLVALFDATLIGLGLVITGVPLALPLAVMTFLAAYVPYIGAVSAGAAAVLVALVSQGLVTALIVVAIILVVQQLEGNVVEPLIMGRALHVHPVLIVLGVVAGGVLAGIIGSIIATPLLAALSGAFNYLRQRQLEAERADEDGGPRERETYPSAGRAGGTSDAPSV